MADLVKQLTFLIWRDAIVTQGVRLLFTESDISKLEVSFKNKTARARFIEELVELFGDRVTDVAVDSVTIDGNTIHLSHVQLAKNAFRYNGQSLWCARPLAQWPLLHNEFTSTESSSDDPLQFLCRLYHYDAFAAGPQIAKLFQGEQIGELDIYFKTDKTFHRFLDHARGHFGKSMKYVDTSKGKGTMKYTIENLTVRIHLREKCPHRMRYDGQTLWISRPLKNQPLLHDVFQEETGHTSTKSSFVAKSK
jgi:hypothetical protein